MTDQTAQEATVHIVVDGRPVGAKPGELVIAAAERAGVHIPRFCYHPRMNPVGMCRMCIVEVDMGRGPALQPSCMLTVAENMVVHTESEMTKQVQDGVLELLLINHPLDCPVCDKGGECPLQDNTMAFGPGESRFVEEKRHYPKPIAISETVYLDRERCILCDRCTRFAKEVAGDPLIHFINRGNATEVNTFPGEPFSSYFSGNTVQICPVGALTAKPYRFRARPWDLEAAPSTCTTCSVGCSIEVQSSRNEVLRTLGVDSDPVNWSWLCDKGRFGFEATNSSDRLTEPLVKDESGFRPVRWSDALGATARAVDATLQASGPGAIAVLGGARLTNEAAYAWAKFAKGVLGTDNVDAQMGDGLPAEFLLGVPRATIDQACTPGGTILYLGPDSKEALPVLYLRLKHAVVEDGAKLIELGHVSSGLAKYASASLRAAPGGLVELAESLVGGGANAHLVRADGPITLVLGRTSVSTDPNEICAAAEVLLAGFPNLTVLPALTRGNVFGAIDAGLAPGLLPGGTTLEAGGAAVAQVWGQVPASRGRDARSILEGAAAGEIEVLFLLGADPVADFPDRDLAMRALEGARVVIALDLFLTESSSLADLVLPVTGFAETGGSTTNLEGRVTLVTRKVTPVGTAQADWSIAVEVAARLGSDLGFSDLEGLWSDYVAVSPDHGAAVDGLASGDVAGVVLNVGRIERPEVPTATASTPKASALRLVVGTKLYDGGTLVAHSPSLVPLIATSTARLHPDDFAALGVPAGSVVSVSSDTGVIEATVEPHAAVVQGAVLITANVPGAAANDLLSAETPVTDVRIDPRTR